METRGSRSRGAEGEIGSSDVEACLRSDGIRLPPTEKGKLIEGVLGGGRVDRKGNFGFYLLCPDFWRNLRNVKCKSRFCLADSLEGHSESQRKVRVGVWWDGRGSRSQRSATWICVVLC